MNVFINTHSTTSRCFTDLSLMNLKLKHTLTPLYHPLVTFGENSPYISALQRSTAGDDAVFWHCRRCVPLKTGNIITIQYNKYRLNCYMKTKYK